MRNTTAHDGDIRTQILPLYYSETSYPAIEASNLRCTSVLCSLTRFAQIIHQASIARMLSISGVGRSGKRGWRKRAGIGWILRLMNETKFEWSWAVLRKASGTEDHNPGSSPGQSKEPKCKSWQLPIHLGSGQGPLVSFCAA
jgi:hypothetical protein